ncbi:Uncharacterised protein [Legionella sainthelensi]|uniref:hypothetical protein n=1 Tax=Legionella sainthelensi TaxID=28087 RepID=UPI000F6F5136|nr:hypothetical protein [Legionella sainthelensi]VEB38438.1 Uncharacterised protein [Legionella sainthelensi]
MQEDILTHLEIKNTLEACNIELEKFVLNLLNSKHHKFSKKSYPHIFDVYEKHQGLCDIVCNYFTIMDAGSIKDMDLLVDNFKNSNSDEFDYSKMENLSKTHILSLVTFVEVLKFIFLNIVPYNIFKKSEEKNLRTEENGINRELFKEKMDSLENGAYIKFVAYETNWALPLTGHSMLINKIEPDKYLFFNPDANYPECKFLNGAQLCEKVDDIAKVFEKVTFIDNMKFIQRVEDTIFAAPAKKKSESCDLTSPPRVPIFDKGLLTNKLNCLSPGTMIQFDDFETKNGLKLPGHTLLIHKLGHNDFMFYNTEAQPECIFCTSEQLIEEIDKLAFSHGNVLINCEKLIQKIDDAIIDKTKNLKLELQGTILPALSEESLSLTSL